MAELKVHAIETGRVKVRVPQKEGRGKGLARLGHMLFDDEWTEWLPIYAWAIEHEEGVIVVDTGETARVHERGYHPSWHPFFRRATQFSVHPDEEIGPQLRRLGIAPRDVRQVVLTHLHTDHAGGLAHLTGSRMLATAGELRRASGWSGRIQGYLPNRWPKWWEPEAIRFERTAYGPFAEAMALTRNGDVMIVPTPGHTPDHVSVVVRGETDLFLAGDTSYTEQLMLAGKVDGVSPDEEVSHETLKKIARLAKERPLVYLPSHDLESAQRLRMRSVVKSGT